MTAVLRRRRFALRMIVLAVVLVVAGLLRLDAFVGKYGTLDAPAWAHVMTTRVAPLAGALRPERVQWYPEETPYVGGDPINYLAYAREMTSFYQPHVREPVFLALTRLSLWAVNDHDSGVSLASSIGSMLAVLAAYLLGTALLSPAAGLIAAGLLAIEIEVITWAPDGWRDDTFTAAVLFAAWALLRLHRSPGFGTALVAGVLCAIACLTRITALTFVVPALAWIVVAAPRTERRALMSHAALALLIAVVVVAPYLVSMTIATGDPLFALNYHTSYYRHAEGLDHAEPMSAAQYIRTKFTSRPLGTLDTGFEGLFLQPFITKWNGFDQWVRGSGTVLSWIAVAGLALLPLAAAGRLLLLILLTSLLPYAFTWNLGGGSEWRFTMHAYPFYLVAAGSAVVASARVMAAAARVGTPRPSRRAALAGAAVIATAALGAALYVGLPWFVAREAIGTGEPTSIATGRRDGVFYRRGWLPPHRDGVTVRVSAGEQSTIRLPMAGPADYDLVLRIDPVAPQASQRVSIFFNRRLVGVYSLTFDPGRMGSYTVSLPADAVRRSGNELMLVVDPVVTAEDAGPRFSTIDPRERIGVRLWYVRLTRKG